MLSQISSLKEENYDPHPIYYTPISIWYFFLSYHMLKDYNFKINTVQITELSVYLTCSVYNRHYLESDYFTLRKWALNLQTYGFTPESLVLIYISCLMRWGCNFNELEPWYLYNWPLYSICKSVIFSTKKFGYT